MTTTPPESTTVLGYSQFRDKYRRRSCIHSDVAGYGAQIWQCTDKLLKKTRSMKILKKEKVSRAKFLQEVSILKECNGHPNLPNVYDVYECDKYYYIVMDDVDHPTIVEALTKSSDMDSVGAVLRGLLRALLYLHQQKIAHARISAKTILVPEGTSPTQFVLVDFSNACRKPGEEEAVDLDDVSIDTESSSSCSSDAEEEKKSTRKRKKKSPFHPPEYDETGPTPAGDMWALGILSFLLYTGRYPFQKPADTKKPIQNWYTIQTPSNQQMIAALLQYNPTDRPTAQELTDQNSVTLTTDFTGYEDDLKQVMGRLSDINREYAFKKAVRSYISANLLQESNQERLARIFQLADVNHDNQFSKAEFEQALLEADIEVSPQKLNLYFQLLDVNGDQQISYTEFMAFAAEEEILFEKKKLKAAFEAFNLSKTGYITAEDLKQFSGSAGGSSAFRGERALKSKAIQEMIQQVDKNGDGKISFDEFAQMMVKKAYFAVFSW